MVDVPITDADLVAKARDAVVDYIVEEDLKENPPQPQIRDRVQAMAAQGIGTDKAEQILLYLGGHAGSIRLDDILLPFSDGTLDSVEEVLGVIKQMAAEGRIEINAGRVVLR